MRITGGSFKNRKLAVPKGLDIRPTTDKVRQAIFNILVSYELPQGAQVLDIFCGTGALGLEALSRGAAHCTFIDKKTTCVQQNTQEIAASDSYNILTKDSLKTGTTTCSVDLLFCDPPYRKNLLIPTLESLAQNNWLKNDALCVIECEKDYSDGLPENFSILDQRHYGDIQIIIARYK